MSVLITKLTNTQKNMKGEVTSKLLRQIGSASRNVRLFACTILSFGRV